MEGLRFQRWRQVSAITDPDVPHRFNISHEYQPPRGHLLLVFPTFG